MTEYRHRRYLRLYDHWRPRVLYFLVALQELLALPPSTPAYSDVYAIAAELALAASANCPRRPSAGGGP